MNNHSREASIEAYNRVITNAYGHEIADLYLYMGAFLDILIDVGIITREQANTSIFRHSVHRGNIMWLKGIDPYNLTLKDMILHFVIWNCTDKQDFFENLHTYGPVSDTRIFNVDTVGHRSEASNINDPYIRAKFIVILTLMSYGIHYIDTYLGVALNAQSNIYKYLVAINREIYDKYISLKMSKKLKPEDKKQLLKFLKEAQI